MMRIIVWTTVVIGLLYVLAIIGMRLPFDFVTIVIFGWILYLARTLPAIRIDSTSAITRGFVFFFSRSVCIILRNGSFERCGIQNALSPRERRDGSGDGRSVWYPSPS